MQNEKKQPLEYTVLKQIRGSELVGKGTSRYLKITGLRHTVFLPLILLLQKTAPVLFMKRQLMVKKITNSVKRAGASGCDC